MSIFDFLEIGAEFYGLSHEVIYSALIWLFSLQQTFFGKGR